MSFYEMRLVSISCLTKSVYFEKMLTNLLRILNNPFRSLIYFLQVSKNFSECYSSNKSIITIKCHNGANVYVWKTGCILTGLLFGRNCDI